MIQFLSIILSSFCTGRQELNSSISTLHLLQWFLFFIMDIFVFSEVSPVFLEECMILDSK